MLYCQISTEFINNTQISGESQDFCNTNSTLLSLLTALSGLYVYLCRISRPDSRFDSQSTPPPPPHTHTHTHPLKPQMDGYTDMWFKYAPQHLPLPLTYLQGYNKTLKIYSLYSV